MMNYLICSERFHVIAGVFILLISRIPPRFYAWMGCRLRAVVVTPSQKWSNDVTRASKIHLWQDTENLAISDATPGYLLNDVKLILRIGSMGNSFCDDPSLARIFSNLFLNPRFLPTAVTVPWKCPKAERSTAPNPSSKISRKIWEEKNDTLHETNKYVCIYIPFKRFVEKLMFLFQKSSGIFLPQGYCTCKTRYEKFCSLTFDIFFS